MAIFATVGRSDLIFEFAENGEKFGSFEGLDDKGVSTNAAGFVLFEGFQLAYGQQHGDMPCITVLLDTLANLQAAIARHVHIQHNQVGPGLSNFLEGSRPVIDGNDRVTGIGEDLSAHVLGGYAVICEQDFPRQGCVLRDEPKLTCPQG